jgi:hypothetical protein
MRGKCIKPAVWVALTLFLAVLASGAVFAAEAVTIVGTVNDEGALVGSDDKIYELGENEKGDELVERVGAKVEVKGTVTVHEDGSQTIDVDSYKVLEE